LSNVKTKLIPNTTNQSALYCDIYPPYRREFRTPLLYQEPAGKTVSNRTLSCCPAGFV